MKTTLLSFLLVLTSAICINAQCEISNGSFENWSEFPVTGDGITPTNVLLPDDAFPAIRFFFWFFEGNVAIEEALQLDPVSFIGVEQSTDATDGEYAVKLQDIHPDVIGVADIYGIQGCTTLPDSFALDAKHVGDSDTDLLSIYVIFDTIIVPLTADPDNSPYVINDVITGNSAETYERYSFPVVENFPSEVDSFSYDIAAITTANSYFIIDNVKLIYNEPSSIDNELALSTARILQNPVSDLLRLSIDQVIDQPVELMITDLHGRIHMTKSYDRIDNHLELNVQEYLSGTYFLRLKSADGFASYKFVKI